MEQKLTRINKYLSEIGYCSRRAADQLILEKRVKINGNIPEMGTKVTQNDLIEVDDKVVQNQNNQLIYIAVNKPVGIVCTTDAKHEMDNIVDFVNHPNRIFPIGRLDKASEGLILMTNDGDIVNKILRAKNKHQKEYEVTVSQPITQDFIAKMSAGVPILDTVTLPCEVISMGKFRFKIILQQGLNRQIRRMCEYLDYEVTRLKRVRIMHLKLDLDVGKWRDLSPEELKILKESVADSSGTFEPTE